MGHKCGKFKKKKDFCQHHLILISDYVCTRYKDEGGKDKCIDFLVYLQDLNFSNTSIRHKKEVRCIEYFSAGFLLLFASPSLPLLLLLCVCVFVFLSGPVIIATSTTNCHCNRINNREQLGRGRGQNTEDCRSVTIQ